MRVTIELQCVAWETVRRAFRAAGHDAAAPRPRAVSTLDRARPDARGDDGEAACVVAARGNVPRERGARGDGAGAGRSPLA